jgi:LEA14-like dessication related protein
MHHDTHPAMKLALRSAVVLALAATTFGCRTVARHVFTAPTVAFRGVSLVGMGLTGGSIEIVLNVANPNPYSLSASQLTYRLLVQDTVEIGHGSAATALHVGGHDSATVRLPLDVAWRGLQAAGRRMASSGVVDYRVIGEIVADTPIGDRHIPIDQRGSFAAIKP